MVRCGEEKEGHTLTWSACGEAAMSTTGDDSAGMMRAFSQCTAAQCVSTSRECAPKLAPNPLHRFRPTNFFLTRPRTMPPAAHMSLQLPDD